MTISNNNKMMILTMMLIMSHKLATIKITNNNHLETLIHNHVHNHNTTIL